MFGLLGRVYPEGRLGAARAARQDHLPGAGARLRRGVLPQHEPAARRPTAGTLYSNGFRAELAGYNAIEVFRRHARRANHDDPLALIQYIDLKTYLVGDINTKVDRASMAHSLEVREPLMDHPLVEWLATLPSSLKLRGGRGQVAPEEGDGAACCRATCCTGRRWASPCRWRHWFRGPLKQRVRDAVLGERLADSGLFDPATLRRLVDQHQSGVRDHSAPLWSLLMFEAFLRTSGVERRGDSVRRATA